jgi:hypothetical protein
VAISESDAAGLLTLTGSTAVTIRDQRAYNASNTKDVATIATLDAYTPMVRTVNNQTINGTKTFLVTAVNNQKWRVQNNNEGISTVPAAQVQTQPLDISDANGAQIYFDQMLTNTDGSRAWRQNLYDTAGHRMVLHMQANADGTGYLTAPFRAYNTANVSDVVTIGTLKASTDVVHTTGAETIQGIKTFHSAGFTSVRIGTTRTGDGNLGGYEFFDGTNKRTGTIIGMGNGIMNLYPNPDGAVSTNAVIITGQRAYNASNTSDVVTIGTLDAYTPMVRTTGNQEISGNKTLTGDMKVIAWGAVGVATSSGIILADRDTSQNVVEKPTLNRYFPPIMFEDGAGTRIGGLRVVHNPNGTCMLVCTLRNADGTYKNITLATSDA